MNMNEQKLNTTELAIHKKLIPLLKENNQLKILEAAGICDVSASKISKYVKKLGFDNFKQYRLYFSRKEIYQEKRLPSHEIERIKNYLEQFDETLVDQFLEQINAYDKIVFFGLGPSFICLEYFSYKLNFILDKKIVVTQEESYAYRLAETNTLVIIFSVSGDFSSFERVFREVKKKQGNVLLVLEEYNNQLSDEINNVLYLTKSFQKKERLAYEKTRTVFFIFIEEVLTKLIA